MTRRIILALAGVAALAGCATVKESRLNPLNWFGKSESAEVVTTTQASSDPRPLVAQVVTLRAEPVPGGAIIRATGLPQIQGYYDGALVPVNGGVPVNGVLNYEFRASSPEDQTRSGPERSREVIVGVFVSEQSLNGVNQIRVSGASNALVVRR